MNAPMMRRARDEDQIATIEAALARIATELDAKSATLPKRPVGRDVAVVIHPPAKISLIEKAETIYRARRRRDAIFGAFAIFGEPSFDVLLDLYVATMRRSAISVSSACIASASPPTTGLRHVTRLEETGLVQRQRDPFDARRVYLTLSQAGVELMEEFLSAV